MASKLEPRLVVHRMPAGEAWRYQLFLVVADQWLEIGGHQRTVNDIDALAVIVRRVLPKTTVQWNWGPH